MQNPGIGFAAALFAISLLTSPATAQIQPAKKGFSVSVQGSTGILEGKAIETVYNDTVWNGYKLSELDWDLKQLTFAGVALSFEFEPVCISLTIKSTVTEGTGEMRDYDWMEPSISDWTDYSRSDVRVLSGSMIDLRGSFRFLDKNKFALRGMAGLKYDNWQWTDSGREFIYSVNGFRDYVGDFGGVNVIQYEQMFIVPYAGINATFESSPFRADGYFMLSPFVTAQDKDFHVLRDLRFEENFYGGLFVGIGFSGSLLLGEHVWISLAVDHQSIPEFRGDMTVQGETTVDAAGIGNEATMVSASAGVRF